MELEIGNELPLHELIQGISRAEMIKTASLYRSHAEMDHVGKRYVDPIYAGSHERMAVILRNARKASSFRAGMDSADGNAVL